ncbi:MAG: hypothetical protein K5Q00_00395 [Gammaproteobacteria bacterium]|nr:hypothetical protein [Gammaproteobacteria bacterium]
MSELLLVNQIRPGQLNAYKAFLASLLESRKEEYTAFLKRYDMVGSTVHYHKIDEVEFVVVRHSLGPNAYERLANYPTSEHPFDMWFKEQLAILHDIEQVSKAGQPQELFAFELPKA